MMPEPLAIWRWLSAGLILLVITFAAAPARAQTPECNDNPCVITRNGGGSVVAFEKLAARLVRTRERLEIVGPCYSACTMLADQARPFVCIREGAEFHIHQSMMFGPGPENGLRAPVRYSPDLDAYINNRGGQPTVGWLSIPYQTALLFWPACEPQVS